MFTEKNGECSIIILPAVCHSFKNKGALWEFFFFLIYEAHLTLAIFYHSGTPQRRLGWINTLYPEMMNNLTKRPQCIRLLDCISNTMLSSTGALQGRALPLFLLTLYIADCLHDRHGCHIQKLSADTAIEGSITSDECEHKRLTKDFRVEIMKLPLVQ